MVTPKAVLMFYMTLKKGNKICEKEMWVKNMRKLDLRIFENVRLSVPLSTYAMNA